MNINLNFPSTIRLIAVGTLATVSLSASAIALAASAGIAAPPNPHPGHCPDGWVPLPPGMNPALGDCMPDSFVQPGGGVVNNNQLPDLTIKTFNISKISPQKVSVQVLNKGNGIAKRSKLRLTVQQIKGTPVNRTIEAKLPFFKPSQSSTILVDASSILPKDVALSDTAFKLTLDSTNVVTESNESNNEALHKP
ncbi:CARDB domain-containing protein [Myxacorys almedinensis]|uniref:CARDB domain-containing protein n=1 Tax=Myxacorys almedinensis A TaxID=2690445 RepID=A0A8J7Z5U2_9CYAN|nr:CARDB domain-containing protein [Myxacorys almedinensis]NDJ16963.1 hypothetical protein [Myxacorys almedinensis A]